MGNKHKDKNHDKRKNHHEKDKHKAKITSKIVANPSIESSQNLIQTSY